MTVRRRPAMIGAAAALLPFPAAQAGPGAGPTPLDTVKVAPFGTVEVAPGIHVRHGVHEEATADNQDGIANIGFIVGCSGVAVIDPGGSRSDGERLQSRIRQVTDLPVRAVVMTHLHPDHAFGAGAFAASGAAFVAHARLADSLVTRGEFYRNRLADTLGRDAAGDYARPTRLIEATGVIDLGGRRLSLRAHPTAHTDNDLSIVDPQTRTLWAGDLLFIDRVPAVDGSILGWLRVLDEMTTWPVDRAVPGHGPAAVPWPQALAAQHRYLTTIVREVRGLIRRGGDIETAVATVAQSERGHWQLFDDYNGRNVTAAFKELEWE